MRGIAAWPSRQHASDGKRSVANSRTIWSPFCRWRETQNSLLRAAKNWLYKLEENFVEADSAGYFWKDEMGEYPLASWQEGAQWIQIFKWIPARKSAGVHGDILQIRVCPTPTWTTSVCLQRQSKRFRYFPSLIFLGRLKNTWQKRQNLTAKTGDVENFTVSYANL